MEQAANGVISECEVLADLLETIERFVVNRLNIYIEVTPAPEMNDMLVNYIVELISTLARVTQKLERRRSRECFLAGNYSLLSATQSSLQRIFLEPRTSTMPGRTWTD